MTSDLDKGGLEAAVAAFRASTYQALTMDECRDAASEAIRAYLNHVASHQPAPGDTRAAPAPDGLEVVGWERMARAQSRKLQAVLHVPGVKDALHELDWKNGDPLDGWDFVLKSAVDARIRELEAANARLREALITIRSSVRDYLKALPTFAPSEEVEKADL